MLLQVIHIFFEQELLADAIIPYRYLLNVSFALFVCILSMLVFIIFYLLYYLSRTTKRRHLINLFSDLISELILCETQSELEDVLISPGIQKTTVPWFSKPFGRKVLLHELVTIHKSISGKGAENIRWFFEQVHLQDDCLHHLQSKKWQRKAAAIQQLAEMNQQQALRRIYRATNSKNHYVRTEAQVAIVKLTGFRGLRFLNVITHPLTQWQQLCLLRELSQSADYETAKLVQWLGSKNETVVELSLRLIKIYSCFELHDEVARCLQHASPVIRTAAIDTLLEIASDNTAQYLVQAFDKASKSERLAILSALQQVGTSEQIPFLKQLLHQSDAAIKNAAQLLLAKLQVPEIATMNLPYAILMGSTSKADVA